MPFSDFDLDPIVLRGLDAMGYDTPTPVQEQALPAAIEGLDVIDMISGRGRFPPGRFGRWRWVGLCRRAAFDRFGIRHGGPKQRFLVRGRPIGRSAVSGLTLSGFFSHRPFRPARYEAVEFDSVGPYRVCPFH